MKDIRSTDQPKFLMPPPEKKERSLLEQNLVDSIGRMPTATVTLNSGHQVFLTDYIFIRNDSLHIIGNGVKLTADSAYKGPAFTLAASCKYILLDSLILENFDVGVMVMNKGLHLKNVQFNNCKVPIQFQYQLQQNRNISGMQSETLFHHLDSFAK